MIARPFLHILSLVLLLVGSPWAASAENIPFLELTYRAADGCRPPAPLDAWWTESCQEAIHWWNEATGSAIDSGNAMASLDSLHLLAGGVPAQDGFLTPTFAGWLRETSPILAPSVIAAAARWTGFMTESFAGGCRVRGAEGLLPEDMIPQPGMYIVLHGKGVAEELRRKSLHFGEGGIELPRHPAPPDASRNPMPEDLQTFIAGIIPGWNASAGIEPHPGGTSGWLSTGCPSRWFRPVDGAMVGHLPADVQAWLAVGIDGRACGEDLQAALAAQGRTSVWPLAWFPRLDPALLGMMLDGTWLVAQTPTGNLMRVPRSTALDALIAGLGVSLHQQYPVDERPVRLVDGLLWARSPADWIIGTTPEAIARWFDGSARLQSRSPASAVLIGYATGAVTSSFISPCLRREEPMPVRAWPSIDVMGREPEVATAWTVMAAALDQAGDHHVLGTDHDGTLRIELGGPVLPWLLPGLAIRWFADIAQDEEGKREILSGLQRVRASGRPATLAEYRQALPSCDPVRLAAWGKAIDELASQSCPEVEWLQIRLRDALVPWPSTGADRAIIDQAHAIMESTALFDDPSLPGGRIMASVATEIGFNEAQRKWSRRLAAARLLAGYGLFLASHGDPGWALLSQRAIRLVGQPENWVDVDSLRAFVASRDSAWMAYLSSGQIDHPAIERWLSEGVPTLFSASAWRYTWIWTASATAEPWLAQGADYPGRFTFPNTHMLRMGLIADQVIRAYTATEIAHLLECDERLERQDLPSFARLNGFRSPWTRSFQPATYIERALDHGRIDQAKHVLVRTAARLVLLEQSRRLPDSQAAATAALGPLVCPMAGTQVPLTYQHLGEHSFRLFVSDQVPPPPDVEPETWKNMVVGMEVPGGRHLVVAQNALEVVVDLRRPTPPKIGSNDF
jgi:hypothetical protein